MSPVGRWVAALGTPALLAGWLLGWATQAEPGQAPYRPTPNAHLFLNAAPTTTSPTPRPEPVVTAAPRPTPARVPTVVREVRVPVLVAVTAQPSATPAPTTSAPPSPTPAAVPAPDLPTPAPGAGPLPTPQG